MSDAESLLASLNPQQVQAVTTSEGPVLVIAGAGSGKTRVITHRIAWLIEQGDAAPWQIFAATFTNKAAEEMRLRVGHLLPGAETGRLAISTFHSLCVSILRREAEQVGLNARFTICDETDQLALIKDCLRSLGVEGKNVKPEQVRNWINTAKIMMLGPREATLQLGAELSPLFGKVYTLYQERLLAGDAVDFDDLLLHVVGIFKEHPEVLKRYQERWRFLLVDEYQDTNAVQFELVRLLAAGHGNICVVGDEDQSIYSWRGAQIENLLEFPEIFKGTRVIRLEQNYRSTGIILKAASSVIAHNRQRMGKQLWSDRGPGEPITMITGHSELDEASQVVQTIKALHTYRGFHYNDTAVFYRVNALSRVFEDQLRQQRVPYRVIGGIKFYDRAEIKDLLAYLRLVINPHDGIALARVINRPARGIGAKSQAAVFNESVSEGVSLWNRMMRLARGETGGISKKARVGIGQLVQMVIEWREFASTHTPREVLERILRQTQYEERTLGDAQDIETISRRENIGELLSALEEFHKGSPDQELGGFLERVALVTAQDEMTQEDCVSLMTLHCAKGLEYRAVFMAGMEEPIFPSQRTIGEQGHMEEERRLFYVGITRAQDLLFLSRADSRRLYGRPTYNPPSLFLGEVPGDLVRSLDDAVTTWMEAAAGGRGPGGAALHEQAPAPQPPEPADASEGRFAVGQRVMHERLGGGQIVSAAGNGERRKVSVRFDAGLELEILERYGGLRPDDGQNERDLPY